MTPMTMPAIPPAGNLRLLLVRTTLTWRDERRLGSACAGATAANSEHAVSRMFDGVEIMVAFIKNV